MSQVGDWCSYGNLKLAQDALTKSITTAEKVVEEVWWVSSNTFIVARRGAVFRRGSEDKRQMRGNRKKDRTKWQVFNDFQ